MKALTVAVASVESCLMTVTTVVDDIVAVVYVNCYVISSQLLLLLLFLHLLQIAIQCRHYDLYNKVSP